MYMEGSEAIAMELEFIFLCLTGLEGEGEISCRCEVESKLQGPLRYLGVGVISPFFFCSVVTTTHIAVPHLM